MSITLSMFVLSLLLLTVTSYAWFAITSSVGLDGFVVTVSDYQADITLNLKKNGGAAEIIQTESEIQAFFANTVPGDYYDFEIIIKNESNVSVMADVFLDPVTNVTIDTNYDMRDVFYIDNGAVAINNQSLTLTPNNLDSVTIGGQTLNLYRVKNLINLQSKLILKSEQSLVEGELLVIKFRLVFDSNTALSAYQAGQLKLGKLVVVLNSKEDIA